MAKAKSKKGKKNGKSGSSNNPLDRLDSKLHGYWKKGQYGEFVTHFIRHWERAQKTSMALYWDQAVYELLVLVLFGQKDFTLLQTVLNSLQSAPELTEQSLACKRIAQAALKTSKAEFDPELLSSLPESAPEPFASLRKRLLDLVAGKVESPFRDYIEGKRKRAKKGEKHFADLARFYNQFEFLRQADFQADSVTVFGNLKKNIREFKNSLEARTGQQSRVISDLLILCEVMRELKLRNSSLLKGQELLQRLKTEGFSFYQHPVVLQLLKTVLYIGAKRFGQQWAVSHKLLLADVYPQLMPELPEYVYKQLQVKENKADDKVSSGKPFIQFLDEILAEKQAWSEREQYILQATMLYLLYEHSQELAHESSYLDWYDLTSVSSGLISKSIQVMQGLLDLYHKYCPPEREVPEGPLFRWRKIVMPFPIYRREDDILEFTKFLVKLNTPNYIFLFLLAKSTESYRKSKANKIVELIKKQKGSLVLSEKDLLEARFYLEVLDLPHSIFSIWQQFISQAEARKIAENFLWQNLKQSCKRNEAPILPFFEPENPWLDIPHDLLEQFLQVLDKDFALYGLLRLTLSKPEGEPPMPKGVKDARLFLDYPPPDATLYSMLFWMLTWPKTQYSNTFLYTIIAVLAEYITERDAWLEIVDLIITHNYKKLAEQVWELWQEKGIVAKLAASPDFKAAAQKLEWIIRPKKSSKSQAKGSAAKGPKGKKTLLQEILEERKKQRQNRE